MKVKDVMTVGRCPQHDPTSRSARRRPHAWPSATRERFPWARTIASVGMITEPRHRDTRRGAATLAPDTPVRDVMSARRS
jgi:hypothetical protein